MKHLILLLCLLLLPTGAGSIDLSGIAISGIGVETSGGAACTTSNDSALFTSAWVATSTSSTNVWGCSRITGLNTTDDITEYDFGLCDLNQSGSVTFSLWTDDVSGQKPGSEISGTSVTLAHGDISDCGTSDEVQTATLAATKVDIGYTTVWLCSKEVSPIGVSRSLDDEGSYRCEDGDQTPDWSTCNSGYTHRIVIRGCSE